MDSTTLLTVICLALVAIVGTLWSHGTYLGSELKQARAERDAAEKRRVADLYDAAYRINAIVDRAQQ